MLAILWTDSSRDRKVRRVWLMLERARCKFMGVIWAEIVGSIPARKRQLLIRDLASSSLSPLAAMTLW